MPWDLRVIDCLFGYGSPRRTGGDLCDAGAIELFVYQPEKEVKLWSSTVDVGLEGQFTLVGRE